jgi:SAM-dependent methyltransferase
MTTDWAQGYVTDIGYTHGYYSELNPQRLQLAFLNQGLAFPEIRTACELGFGQGMSVNIHAAASAVQWYGTDFNPSQSAFAQGLAAASGANVKLYDDAFAEFASRPDLPDFDFIALHGIWSWISDTNRLVLCDFIRRKLKAGGVLYLSYNTLPGWSAFAPMRHLMWEHAQRMGIPGSGIVNRIDGAIGFTEKLLSTDPAFSRANTQVAQWLSNVKDHKRQYLAHEYFNRDWRPMFFAEVAETLASAKMQFACSAHYLDHIDPMNLSFVQQAFLNDLPDADLRQTARDYLVNQQFRKDYWVKGPRKLHPFDRAEQLRQQKVVLISNRGDVPLTAAGTLGECRLQENIYRPLLDTLAHHQSMTLGQLEQTLKPAGVQFAQLVEATLVLAGANHLAPVQADQVISMAHKHTSRFNAHLCHQARSSTDMTHLASPVIGGGFAASRFEQLFLASVAQGKTQPPDWARYVMNILDAQGQAMLKDGKTLMLGDEVLAELTAQASTFQDRKLPLLKALQIA